MKYNFILFILISILTACQDNDLKYRISNNESNRQEIVTVSNEGFLEFPTYKSLETFLNQVQNGENPDVSTSSRGFHKFESISMLDKRIAELNNTNGNSRNFEVDEDSEELEEMTLEEYNLMKAEELLFDGLLTHAMDTTLRICVEGQLYKITNDGTFSVNVEDSEKLDKAIREFNPDLKEKVDAGATIQINPEVKFTNTFKNIQLESDDGFEYEPETSNDMNSRAASFSAKNEFHKSYGADSYKWKNNSLYQKFLDFLRGKDVSREKKFSKKRRVQVNVFDVNYLFYKSAGVKVKMQKRKTFCFIPYWVGIEADKLAIGFNEMDGVLKYNNPNNMSSIMPTASAKWNKFTGTINGITGSFLYGAYHNLKFIKDWTDVIFGWMPELKIGNKNYTDTFINKIYNAPADMVYQHTKKIINKTVYTPIAKQIKPTDPMLAYLIWGTSSTQFNKEHPYITGVKEYSNRKSKSVIFDRSFGVSFYGSVPAPYTPSDFDIKNIDVFGAAYYNNKWLGVRFYTKK